jgi:hypothetical protein
MDSNHRWPAYETGALGRFATARESGDMPAVADCFDSETDFNAELESVIGSVVVQAREHANAHG